MAFSPDGKVLASGGADGTIKLAAVQHVRAQDFEPSHHEWLTRIAVSRSHGGQLAIGTGQWYDRSMRGEIVLWNLAPREYRVFSTADHPQVRSVAFAPDGRIVATGSGVGPPRPKRGNVELWDVSSGNLLRSLPGHRGAVWGLAFSPDGKTLAAGDFSGHVELWDRATGAHRATLEAHTSWVYSVASSPDRRTLAAGGRDKTVRLWHVATGSELAALETHLSVESVAFFPDGETLAATFLTGQSSYGMWTTARKC